MLRAGVRSSLGGTNNRAFTLVEVLVVVVILVLLATMMVPRLLTNDIRIYRATCEEVADMLMMFAQRDALSQQPVGLFYDESAHQIQVRLYDIDPESNDPTPEWRRDRFIRPVQLPDFVELLEVREDHAIVDIRQWPLTSRPGQHRPWIEIVLGGPDDEMTSISLAPHEVSPLVYSHSEQPPLIATPIDLNAAGRMREEW
jgi:prepilin-type N-terminal cleavage/methylation domain-containing protein